MKDLTDKKKVKEIEKDIKSLEKAKVKLEKMISKKGGKAKKEVIDEIDDEREEMADEYVEDANKRQDAGQKISSILSNYPNISLNNKQKLKGELENRSENYDLAVRGVTPKLDDLDGNGLDQEAIESIIDTYNAESKPWMKLESDELEMLKLDLIGKYLGTDND
jgi:seryl-tRNA synthetase